MRKSERRGGAECGREHVSGPEGIWRREREGVPALGNGLYDQTELRGRVDQLTRVMVEAVQGPDACPDASMLLYKPQRKEVGK